MNIEAAKAFVLPSQKNKTLVIDKDLAVRRNSAVDSKINKSFISYLNLRNVRSIFRNRRVKPNN